MIVDLDVHHGNGTAFIFESDPRVFTFSMHQQHNYPMWKPRGSLDIGLPDGTHDATYLRELEKALPTALAHGAECVFYLAGADPFEDDQLGGLRLTKDGLRTRDRMVIGAAREAGVPLVVVLAGGYARNVDDTVDIHCATIEEAAARARPGRPGGRGRHGRRSDVGDLQRPGVLGRAIRNRLSRWADADDRGRSPPTLCRTATRTERRPRYP